MAATDLPSQMVNSEEEAELLAEMAAPAVPYSWQSVSILPSPRWHWLLVIVLAVLLMLQIVLAQRAQWAGDARWRPALTMLCNVLGCTLPLWHEPNDFVMLQRQVRPEAQQPGVLLAQATFKNQAAWAQAWPNVRFSLSDADGRLIGQRVVLPQEYLPPSEDVQSLIKPGQSAHIAFRLRDPDQSTVAFRFEFL